MDILVLCYEYPPIGGGGGVGAQKYAEAWAAKGHSVTVLTSRASGLAARERINGVDIIRVMTVGRNDRATSTFLSMLSYNFIGLIYVLFHLSHFKHFQVINTHFSIPTGPLASMIAKLLRLPNVLTIIGGDIYDPSKKSSPHRSVVMRFINRWVINSADRVIAISSDTKKRAELFYQIKRPIRIVNYGFKPNLPGNRCAVTETNDSSQFYLIAVGRLVSRKGFEYLIRAMKHLPDNVVLFLIGDGPLEPNLKLLAREEKVLERVKMLGFQTREQIHHYLQKADCFVLPSLHEGLGIVVQEAMDAGLPIVVTNNGGQVDLINYPRNGILVETENAEMLAEAIHTLYTDRALAKSMGRNNLIDIEKLHIDKNCEFYIEEFDKAIAAFNPKASKEVA